MNQNEINRLNELSKEIGKWSEENFGDNGMGEFKHCRPLMGIVEEYGEYIDANSMDSLYDSLADIGIYCLDLCYQTGCTIHLLDDTDGCDLASCIGKINRVVLKRIQKIRGYDDDNKFESELTFHCSCFFQMLDEELHHQVYKKYSSIVELIEDVWAKTVSKRNWKANKENGAANV